MEYYPPVMWRKRPCSVGALVEPPIVPAPRCAVRDPEPESRAGAQDASRAHINASKGRILGGNRVAVDVACAEVEDYGISKTL